MSEQEEKQVQPETEVVSEADTAVETVVEAAPEASAEETVAKKESKPANKPKVSNQPRIKKHGKKYKESAKLVNADREYSLDEAMALLIKTAFVKFDATAEAHILLGIDPKKADQAIRGTINLPHGSGRSQRVLVFAEGDAAIEAKDAGAEHVGSDDLIAKIKEGWLEFDVVVATPDLMARIAQLGRILGTKGMMPNPKAGTVTKDVGKAVQELKAGRIEYRLEKMPIIHTVFGKVSFGPEKLKENFVTLLGALMRAKPATSKGNYLQDVYVNATMGPGIRLSNAELRALK